MLSLQQHIPKADFAAAPLTTLPLTPGIVLQVSKEASLPAASNPPITPLQQDGGIEKVYGGGAGRGGAREVLEEKRESDIFIGLTFISVWMSAAECILKGSGGPKLPLPLL